MQSWSPQQAEALAVINDWLDARDQPSFYLAGYAGTGKTTLASTIAYQVDTEVCFAAFTGKAAAVMRAKGCAGASTIDSLIYRSLIEVSCAAVPPCAKPHCTERCRHRREQHVGRVLNDDSAVIKAGLIVIDEVSMVGTKMGADLLSFGKPILVLGDPAQLPPIHGGGFFTEHEPDLLLTEIHRQALRSPIIQLATRVREGRRCRYGTYGASAVTDTFPEVGEMLEFDQVICGLNATRHRLNKQMRRVLGYQGPTPHAGEKLVCLKNNHKLGLLNGTLWTAVDAQPARRGFVEMVVKDDDGFEVEVLAPEAGFSQHSGTGNDLPEQPFAFGYAITCHKAQGSQWDSVLVIDESGAFREHAARWLYTALTRAAKRVTLVTMR